MSNITIKVPQNVELDTIEIRKFLAAKLYELGKLSLGQAAEMAGFSKVAFAEIIGDFGVSLVNYPVSEIKKDAQKI